MIDHRPTASGRASGRRAFGIAIASTVFAAAGSFASPAAVSQGVRMALLVTAAISAAGALAGVGLRTTRVGGLPASEPRITAEAATTRDRKYPRLSRNWFRPVSRLRSGGACPGLDSARSPACPMSLARHGTPARRTGPATATAAMEHRCRNRAFIKSPSVPHSARRLMIEARSRCDSRKPKPYLAAICTQQVPANRHSSLGVRAPTYAREPNAPSAGPTPTATNSPSSAQRPLLSPTPLPAGRYRACQRQATRQ